MPTNAQLKDCKHGFIRISCDKCKDLCQTCEKRKAVYQREGWGDIHCQRCVESELSGSFEPIVS